MNSVIYSYIWSYSITYNSNISRQNRLNTSKKGDKTPFFTNNSHYLTLAPHDAQNIVPSAIGAPHEGHTDGVPGCSC